MNISFNRVSVWLGVACLLVSTVRTQAFALLGPVQPWMQASNGVILPGDIGGPMDITNGYRWNVPVVTYGFDRSFIKFFGTNGVAAVESAIKIINDLPPASQIVLTNYPFVSLQANYSSQAQGLLDLKSQALPLLLQQLGLAQPTRYIYVIKNWNPNYFNSGNGYIGIIGMPIFYEQDPYGIDPAAGWLGTPGYVLYCVTGLNFDPNTYKPTVLINNTEYGCSISIQHFWPEYIEPFPVNPLADIYAAVADASVFTGGFYAGLTRDDVGGLRYLLSTNNVKYETLLPGVQSADRRIRSIVNGAWRPGVDKITFVPQPMNARHNAFRPLTQPYTDTYITNGILVHQRVQRLITTPDFLFTAGNDTFRTGTTNWINNAALNNNPAGAGPGIIQPPVVIRFQKTGSYFYDWISYTPPEVISEDAVQNLSFEGGMLGSFDGSTNAPIAYPAPQTGNISMAIRVLLRHSNRDPNVFDNFEWSPTSQVGTVYAFQTSTNLSTWNTLFTVTNNGSVCTYQNDYANSSSRFYRLTPQ